MLPARSPIWSALLFAALLLWSGCGAEAGDGKTPPTLVFTAIPDDNATLLDARFAPLAEHLAEQLGVEVRYFATSSYQASVEAFRNGDVQLAWFGGLTGAQARAAVPGSRAVAQGAIDPHFKSYFVVHAETGVERSEAFPMELEGMRFTFGSDSSTSGRLMPEHFIRTFSGRAPEDFFGAPSHFSGSHDKTAKLVESGTFQAGALSYKSYERMVAEGRLDPELCRIAWVTPEYADYNWTVRPSLDETYGDGFTGRLTSALIQLDDPALLAAVDRAEGLVPASNADFEALHELASDLGFLGH